MYIYKSIYTYVLSVYVADMREATYTGSLEIYRKKEITHAHSLTTHMQPHALNESHENHKYAFYGIDDETRGGRFTFSDVNRGSMNNMDCTRDFI